MTGAGCFARAKLPTASTDPRLKPTALVWPQAIPRSGLDIGVPGNIFAPELGPRPGGRAPNRNDTTGPQGGGRFCLQQCHAGMVSLIGLQTSPQRLSQRLHIDG